MFETQWMSIYIPRIHWKMSGDYNVKFNKISHRTSFFTKAEEHGASTSLSQTSQDNYDQWWEVSHSIRCESGLSLSTSSPFLTRVQAPRPRKKDSRGHLSNWEKKRTPHLSFSHSHSHPGLPAADSTSFLCRTTQKKPRLTTPAKSARSIKSSNKFQSETAVKLPNSTAEIELF